MAARIDSTAPGRGGARLERFAQEIARVKVHLSDENSYKDGSQKRRVMEAVPGEMQPVAVTDQAENLEQAVPGAADKLGKLLDHERGRVSDQ